MFYERWNVVPKAKLAILIGYLMPCVMTVELVCMPSRRVIIHFLLRGAQSFVYFIIVQVNTVAVSFDVYSIHLPSNGDLI